MSDDPRTRAPMWRADALVVICYLVALGAAVAVGAALPAWHPIWVAATADVVATLVVFAFSYALGNSSFYDPYWSVAPPIIGVYFALSAPSVTLRSWMILALLFLYGGRLTWNWRRGWTGLLHEDWRYAMLAEKSGRAYWLVSFLGIHLYPTVEVFLGCVPLYVAMSAGAAPRNALDAVAWVVTLTAIAIEGTADNQLRAFRLRPRDPASGVAAVAEQGEILDSGLWAWSRHPNYFGEVLFWIGLYLYGLAGNLAWWWSGAGALVIASMFAFISVPMMDKRMLARRPAFAERMKRVSAVVPWFRKG